jgi:hypothetical protein
MFVFKDYPIWRGLFQRIRTLSGSSTLTRGGKVYMKKNHKIAV